MTTRGPCYEGNAKQPHTWQREQRAIRRRVIETVTMVALSIQELRRLLLQKMRTPDMRSVGIGQSGDVTIKLKPMNLDSMAISGESEDT
jgi:hypothetical protein